MPVTAISLICRICSGKLVAADLKSAATFFELILTIVPLVFLAFPIYGQSLRHPIGTTDTPSSRQYAYWPVAMMTARNAGAGILSVSI